MLANPCSLFQGCCKYEKFEYSKMHCEKKPSSLCEKRENCEGFGKVCKIEMQNVEMQNKIF